MKKNERLAAIAFITIFVVAAMCGALSNQLAELVVNNWKLFLGGMISIFLAFVIFSDWNAIFQKKNEK